MEINMNIEPFELAENIVDDREAGDICAEILHQWNLPQKMYEQVLDEIPDYAIKQYLKKLRQMEKDHCETLTELLKKKQ